MLKESLATLETSHRIWGVSSESLVLYLADKTLSTNTINLFKKLETIRTNSVKDDDHFLRAHAWLSEYLGLCKKGIVTPLGLLSISSPRPTEVVRVRLLDSMPPLRRLLMYAVSKDIKEMPYSEFEGFLPDETALYAKLFSSFGILRLKGRFPDPELLFDISRVNNMIPNRDLPRDEGNWVVAKTIVGSILQLNQYEVLDVVTTRLLDSLGVSYKVTDSAVDIFEVLSHLGYPVEAIANAIFSHLEELRGLLKAALDQVGKEMDELSRHLTQDSGMRSGDVRPFNLDLSQEAHALGVDAEGLRNQLLKIVRLNNRFGRLLTSYIPVVFQTSLDSSTNLLTNVFGQHVSIGNPYTRIDQLFGVDSDGSLEIDYANFALRQYHHFAADMELLTSITRERTSGENLLTASVRSGVSQVVDGLLDQFVASKVFPHNFVYTLPNPEALGEETIEKYIDGNAPLEHEISKISGEWPLLKTDNEISYVNATDRLLSLGLERELKVQELRIMTPYIDYELSKYVAMIRRLIAKGFKVMIVSRLDPSPRSWKTLQESFLKGLGEKSKSVEYRTFTRFKEYRSAAQLKKLGEHSKKEFGVHAKLLIIGGPSEGAALLGSANLLENSYNWNPECGVFTEDPEFIKSAKTFFDFVWDLSAGDNYNLGRLAKIPKGPFIPHAYYS